MTAGFSMQVGGACKCALDTSPAHFYSAAPSVLPRKFYRSAVGAVHHAIITIAVKYCATTKIKTAAVPVHIKMGKRWMGRTGVAECSRLSPA